MPQPDAPPQPDYQAIARQEGTESRNTALFNSNLNRVNQYTPGGSLTWSRDTPLPTAVMPPVSDGVLRLGHQDSPTRVPATSSPANVTYGPEGNSQETSQQVPAAVPATQIEQSTAAAPQDDGTGWNQTLTYSPENQRLYEMDQQARLAYGNTGLAALGRVESALGTPLDTSSVRDINYGTGATQSDGMDLGVLSRYIGQDLPQAQAGLASAGTATAGAAEAGRNITSTFDRSGVRALPGNIDDTSRQRVEEALMSRLDPRLQRDEEMLRNRLLNSGIEVGTDAYNRELTVSGQHRNDARMQAILAGGQEESRQVGLQQGLQAQEYGQALSAAQYRQAAESQMSGQETQVSLANAGMQTAASQANAGYQTSASQTNANNQTQTSTANSALEAARRAQMVAAYGDATRTNAAVNQQNYAQGQDAAAFQNDASQQALAREIAMRQMPLNEANALRSGAQVNMPAFQSYYTGAGATPPPIMDGAVAAGTAANNAYAQQTASQNALYGGLATVGSAAIPFLPFSDIRVKKNIRRIGDHPAGVGRYTWDWIDGSGSSYGVIAQELQKVRPDAVGIRPDGFLGVRYDLIGGQ